MAAHTYPELLELVSSGQLRPDLLIGREISLDDAAQALRTVGTTPGITVITQFS
jgi:threonine dehydrogenase-like Zn-dependent dehydrogenase